MRGYALLRAQRLAELSFGGFMNNEFVDQLDSGSFWRQSNGSVATNISFGFPKSGVFASGFSESSGFKAFTSAQQGAARRAMSAWDDIIAPKLNEATNGDAADIKLSQSSTGVSYAHAYFPGLVGHEGSMSSRIQGSAWFRTGDSSFSSPGNGTYGYQTFMHEIGHALGLNHAGNYNGGAPSYGNTGSGWMFYEDTWQYSIMSYFSASHTGADWYYSGNAYAQTPMLYDVLTAQQIYGADMTTRTGDTTYGFGRGDGNALYDFSVNWRPVLTIWDAGGTDTIDLSGFHGTQRLDLREGEYSNITGQMTKNLAIAFGAVIENGTGGTGNDTIIGNAADNVLKGLAGNDKFFGGAGDDLISGGSGYDIAHIKAATTTISVREVTGGLEVTGEGVDIVLNDVELISFDDMDLSYAELLAFGGGVEPDTDSGDGEGGGTDKSGSAAFNFAAASMMSYASQDVKVVNIDRTETSFEIEGNSWKRFELNYEITDDTMLSFRFRSDSKGELQGIGFERDNSLSAKAFFKLFGTDAFSGVIEDFKYTQIGEWQEFEIPLGEYFSGFKEYLVVMNDDDARAKASSEFSDVRIYENGAEPAPVVASDAFDFAAAAMSSFSNQDSASATVSRDEASLSLSGNSWKRFDLDYDITSETMLSFSFRSTIKGEVQGIGFDNGNNSLDHGEIFNLFGTQSYDIEDFSYTGGGEWQEFLIPLGEYLKGNYSHLIIANDDDAGNGAALDFADVRIFERGEDVSPEAPSYFDFAAAKASSFASGQDAVVTRFERTDTDVLLEGNSWKKLQLDYDVTAKTMLRFSFRSTVEGEVQGLGFDSDNIQKPDELFQLYGTQTYGRQDFDYTGAGEWQEFLIPLGDYFSGNVKHLVLMNDDDADAAGVVEFADMEFFEASDAILTNDEVQSDPYDGFFACGPNCSHGDHTHDHELEKMAEDFGDLVGQLSWQPLSSDVPMEVIA